MIPTRLGQLVVDYWKNKGNASESNSLFVGICQKVSLQYRVESWIVSLLRVFSRQGPSSEGLLNSLINALLARSSPPVNPSIFNAVLSRAADWVCDDSPDLMRGVTSKLMTTWMAIIVANDDLDESFKCIEILIKLKTKSFRPIVYPAPLSPFIVRMTTENLQILLAHLYGAMKKESQRSSLDQYLILEVLRRYHGPTGSNLADPCWKMLKCLIWLGDRPCMDSFIRLLSTTRQGESQAVQLALCKKFRDEFESLPIYSAGWMVSCLLLDHCIDGLGRIWKQAGAVVPVYPDVQLFLRSTKPSMVLDGFDEMTQAQSFCDDLLRQGPTRGYSVTAQVVRESKDGKTWRVEIAKVKDRAWQNECRNDWFHYEDRQRKLDTLLALRKDQPIWEPSLPIAAGTKRSADTPSKPAESKRPRNYPVIDID